MVLDLKKWPAKHDNILWYTKDPQQYTFHLDECDRIPLHGSRTRRSREGRARQDPTDVWWHTIVSPTGKEKTGYATQKPLGILERIIKVHSNPARQFWTSLQAAVKQQGGRGKAWPQFCAHRRKHRGSQGDEAPPGSLSSLTPGVLRLDRFETVGLVACSQFAIRHRNHGEAFREFPCGFPSTSCRK